ncbi:MAG: DEAD/DEAH box helicase family protein [Aeromicrobium sp.]|nr:DEAD/DEAH box helicase family protein [Burkholderiales bacterium]
MKLHFESDLKYQADAIEAVCGLFHGQEICRSEFTVTVNAGRYVPLMEEASPDMFGGASPQLSLGIAESELGVGNRLTLLDDQLAKNLSDTQLRNGLPPTSAAQLTGDFTVEMETGTGKTYVYLRTAFELNKRYGFTKFVIVVPSVAIKEGVNKTLEITRDHFESLYPGAKGYEFFQYDSQKLGQVRNFATSPNVQVMVITVGAINKFGDEDEAAAEESDETKRREKSKNVMYRASEKTGGEKPIDLVRATHPIIIVDEPQSVDGGIDGRGKRALDRMNPLCSLRYSATHVHKHNMVYRLDAVDAYEQKLVKQIEVAAATIESANNRPFVKLVSVSSRRGVISAKVMLDVETRIGTTATVQRREVTVQDGDKLEQATNRELYANIRIGTIEASASRKRMELWVPGDQIWLNVGDGWGDVDPQAVHREMIRRTIKEHLDKERRLRPQGIKVLSLFFIDAVGKYRQYDANGGAVKGEYALMFEEEYKRWAKHPDYQSLFAEVDLSESAEAVHNGYFSIDRKRVGTKTVEQFKDTSGDTKADDDTYNLIMRDKEKLLSFDSALKFIFSHSALKEGWDNPNVFQICNFSTRGTERWRRQTIGRGLRLCVNQDGQRLRGFDINTLTVIAHESYEQFADNLQKEIEADTGIRFGVVESHDFAGIALTGATGELVALGVDASKALWTHLKAKGFINASDRVQDALRTALKNDNLPLPPEFEAQRDAIFSILKKRCGKLDVKNSDDRKPIPVRKSVALSMEFKALWDRIKHKTTYRVQFDNDKLITNCILALSEAPPVANTRLQWRRANMAIGRAGVLATSVASSEPVALHENDIELPDVITELQDRTQLTRKTIVRVLTESGRLPDFKRNPQQFIEVTADAINRCKRMALVEGIKYQRIGEAEYWAQELFVDADHALMGYLTETSARMNTTKSVYEHVLVDSAVEWEFADELEKNEAIKVYAKLPTWFKVPTPLGSYNPDWAVLVEKDGGHLLYLVVETKGSLFADAIRATESAKISCGKAHFQALAVMDPPAHYRVARTVADVFEGL